MLNHPSILFCFSIVGLQGDWNQSTWNVYNYINLKLHRRIFHGIPKLALYSKASGVPLVLGPIQQNKRTSCFMSIHLWFFLPLQLLPTKPTEDAENMSPPPLVETKIILPHFSTWFTKHQNSNDGKYTW